MVIIDDSGSSNCNQQNHARIQLLQPWCVCVCACACACAHACVHVDVCVCVCVLILFVTFKYTFCTTSANFSPKLTKTATLKPCFVRSFPNASISVDFPAPGGPDNPILSVGLRVPSCCCLLWWESTFVNNHCACLCFTGCLFSTANKNGLKVKG